MVHIKKDKTKPAAQIGMSEVGSDPGPAFSSSPISPYHVALWPWASSWVPHCVLLCSQGKTAVPVAWTRCKHKTRGYKWNPRHHAWKIAIPSKRCHTVFLINGRTKSRGLLTPLSGSYISLYWNIYNLSPLCFCFTAVTFRMLSLSDSPYCHHQFGRSHQSQPISCTSPSPSCSVNKLGPRHMCTHRHACAEEHPALLLWAGWVKCLVPLASLSCGITALPTVSWPFLLCLIEQVFLSPLILFTISFCLFLPLPALQASCLISFLSPLSHSCLLTDGRAHLIACLVLFHPVLSSEFPLSLLRLKVLSRDWNIILMLEAVPSSHIRVLWLQQERCWNKYGSQVLLLIIPNKGLHEAHSDVLPDESMPSGCPTLARRAVKLWCSVFNVNFPWITQSEFCNLQYCKFCQHVGN